MFLPVLSSCIRGVRNASPTHPVLVSVRQLPRSVAELQILVRKASRLDLKALRLFKPLSSETVQG